MQGHNPDAFSAVLKDFLTRRHGGRHAFAVEEGRRREALLLLFGSHTARSASKVFLSQVRGVQQTALKPRERYCTHFLKSSSLTSGSFVRKATIDQISGSGTPLAAKLGMPLATFERDLEAVVAAQKLERYALFGISQGGATAIAHAVRYPERVTKLVIYGSYALGREEDTADVFAIGAALRIIANEFAHRILVGAARGWFLSARRARKQGEAPRYYERHGLDEQRAYHIVCLMVGHDPVRFKELADEHKLPQDRRQSCGWDYETSAWSWHRVMAPHLRAGSEPKTSIEVIYGDADGTLAPYARGFRELRFLELLAEYTSSRYRWPAPMVMEMRSCGNAGARWTIATRRMHICYELAEEFAELFGEHEQSRRNTERGTKR